MKTGQNRTTNWNINQNHSITEDPSTRNGTNVVEEVLGGEEREKVVERRTRTRTVRLPHRLRT